MSKLKIGYWPISKTLSSAGDRRRLMFWAAARGHKIVTDLNQSVDLIVASENSDFNSSLFTHRQVPIIFDLIDAYLLPLNPYDDLARGIAKKLSRQITGGVKPFSHHVRDFCGRSAAVICSSVEQESLIKSYNNNTHIILDSHDEIPFMDPKHLQVGESNKCRILWEGQPATIRGVKLVSTVLAQLSETNDVCVDFVTDEQYFEFLNKYIRRNTLSLLKKDLYQIYDLVNVVPWTPENLVGCAKRSLVAMIPIDLSIPMQKFKPENRLLIFWRLGLPCLTSPSPAFVRVARQAGVNAVCDNLQDWFENFTQLLNDPMFALKEIIAGQNYLRENHNRDILLKKWDLAIASVMG